MSEALRRATALLARREHTHRELLAKLTSRLGPERRGEIERALGRLEADGLLSDRRFAEEIIRVRAEQWGDGRIARELAVRGVDRDLAVEVMDERLGPEEDRARAALEKKTKGQLPEGQRERDRLRRFLDQRGFSSDAVRRAMKGSEAGG